MTCLMFPTSDSEFDDLLRLRSSWFKSRSKYGRTIWIGMRFFTTGRRNSHRDSLPHMTLNGVWPIDLFFVLFMENTTDLRRTDHSFDVHFVQFSTSKEKLGKQLKLIRFNMSNLLKLKNLIVRLNQTISHWTVGPLSISRFWLKSWNIYKETHFDNNK